MQSKRYQIFYNTLTKKKTLKPLHSQSFKKSKQAVKPTLNQQEALASGLPSRVCYSYCYSPGIVLINFEKEKFRYSGLKMLHKDLMKLLYFIVKNFFPKITYLRTQLDDCLMRRYYCHHEKGRAKVIFLVLKA